MSLQWIEHTPQPYAIKNFYKGETAAALVTGGVQNLATDKSIDLGAQAIGDKVFLFQNASVYREVYSLYTTTDKLNDPAKRKDILAFVKALNETLDVFTNKPEKVYSNAVRAVGMDAAVVKAAWPVHKWSGRWVPDLLKFLVEEGQ